ncbi:S-phase kinase-associated protein 1 [Trichinella pseudospiralis]|uniref:S-phase kinase-associated protein 1 n=1 Tax=Trichinella pseudospiralis TaxID=6337 RepID=A0A0V1E9M3_TRIPS|nr:S-phase kinase-associated protein 1 [Trichinella pseudospiralis]
MSEPSQCFSLLLYESAANALSFRQQQQLLSWNLGQGQISKIYYMSLRGFLQLKCIQYRQMDRQLQVISREGKSFSISLQAAKMSLTLRNMFDYIVNDELNDEIEAIPLGLIDSNTLDKIVQFCEHYKTETNPEEERSYEINEWDSNFFDINISTMFDIAKAADYLQIHRLFDISCKIVAKFLRSKSPQDIRQALGMGNDFEEYQNDKSFKKYQTINS